MARPAIVFIGFMGAGKSTALAAARRAGLNTVEIDALMERELGKPIRQAFEQDGEEAFRAREAEVVGSLLEQADGGAIALGGGSVLSPRVRAALGRHTVVLLEIDAAEAWRRIEGTDRPLATSEADVERLLAERLPLYQELADAVVPMAEMGAVERALPAIRALAEMPEGTKLLWASSASGDYPIMVGRGLLNASWWPLPGRQFLIADTSTVGLLPHERLETFLGIAATIAGEQTKNLTQVGQILEAMAVEGVTREDHVVALGGGVVGDVAGFCAHIYQRGIPVVHLPTTLVAQVDSAYGGKTGVDLPQGKNYAGAYHLPAAVIADTEMLRTLPREELAAGFVEALKTGLLAGGPLWERVRSLETLDPADLADVVFACARYKCAIVAADERDSGLRNVLNLGHTVGHAIEAASGYARYRHGEAISIGLLAALRLSEAPDLRDECEEILRRQGLPVRLDPRIEPGAVLDALQRDKKRTAAGVGFVLLSEPGRPRTGQLVEPAKVIAAVEELYR
ncbi:MAG TPA: bifunctional shikimate kinase/3-dehydroquinate synthase [Solirubrobacterales bacterium]|nr:bifunctional shikimate kinase/3-dehydroquinate synthase [Solirubrobacterales bacterium]